MTNESGREDGGINVISVVSPIFPPIDELGRQSGAIIVYFPLRTEGLLQRIGIHCLQ